MVQNHPTCIMDPFTAIGLADNIINFIGFARKIVYGGYQISNSASGMTPDNMTLSVLLDDLNAVTKGLLVDLPGPDRTGNEEELCYLASACRELSMELAEILGLLKVAGRRSRWQGMRVKWRSIRKESNIEAIERRLSEFQSQILIRLHLMIRYVTRLSFSLPHVNKQQQRRKQPAAFCGKGKA